MPTPCEGRDVLPPHRAQSFDIRDLSGHISWFAASALPGRGAGSLVHQIDHWRAALGAKPVRAETAARSYNEPQIFKLDAAGCEHSSSLCVRGRTGVHECTESRSP
jgi:hypothetical protein